LKALDCLQPRGLMVAFGQAFGIVAPFSVNILSAKGSLYLTRPTLQTYTAKRDELVARADALFALLASGIVKCEVHQRFSLLDTVEAHRKLGERSTIGSSVLQP
jgi:NADPH2:quinone reductase